MLGRLLISLTLVLILPAAAHAAIAPGWSPAGTMSEPRTRHAAVQLDDGRVLVAGGTTASNAPLTSADLFDPVTRTWSRAAPLAFGDHDLRLAKLGDGRVLAVGFGGSVQVYDPRTNGWRRLADVAAFDAPVLVPLVNGKALLAGGFSSAAARLFDPATDTWSSGGTMPHEHNGAQAAPLPNGRVLVHGGMGSSSPIGDSSIYNATSNTWESAKNQGIARFAHGLAALGNGNVVAVGGYEDAFGQLTNVDVFDPLSNTWTGGAPTLSERRDGSALSLANGRVMVLGGHRSDGIKLPGAELSDAAGTSWWSGGLMAVPRTSPAALTLTDGRVLITGGQDGETAFRTAELWTPTTAIASLDDLVAFGAPTVGSATSSALGIINVGAEPLVVGDLSLSGAHAQDFAVSRTRCQGLLQPGSRCWLDLTFKPSAAGQREALLTYAANTTTGTYTLALRATGTALPTIAPLIPQPDGDGDGVPDAIDRCLALTGSAPRQGCPIGVLADPSISYRRVKGGIRVVSYYVKATSGARVTVTCSKGCKRTTTKGKGAKRVRITRLDGKRLVNGSKITITASMPGRLTTTVTDSITRGRRVEGRPRCVPVGC
ncbi:choice-of-anchor D domain-containing protein [Solirubrobacter taibaiensis]|nr:choice-of-anchor D domain-containing protein [Solirubrobacter taibaiensis]